MNVFSLHKYSTPDFIPTGQQRVTYLPFSLFCVRRWLHFQGYIIKLRIRKTNKTLAGKHKKKTEFRSKENDNCEAFMMCAQESDYIMANETGLQHLNI